MFGSEGGLHAKGVGEVFRLQLDERSSWAEREGAERCRRCRSWSSKAQNSLDDGCNRTGKGGAAGSMTNAFAANATLLSQEREGDERGCLQLGFGSASQVEHDIACTRSVASWKRNGWGAAPESQNSPGASSRNKRQPTSCRRWPGPWVCRGP